VCDVELALSAKVLVSLDEPHRISRMAEADQCRAPPPPLDSSPPTHLEYWHRDRGLRRGRPLPEGRIPARPVQGTALRPGCLLAVAAPLVTSVLLSIQSRLPRRRGPLPALVLGPCSLNGGWSGDVVLFPSGRELGQADEGVDAEVLAEEVLELAAFDDLDAVAVAGGEVAAGLADP
jgi:hypothetical protein